MSVAGGLRASVRITLLATALSGIMQACTMVLLARLLGPSDYGFFVVCLSINALSVAFFSTALERAMVIEADEAAIHGRTLPLLIFQLAVAGVTVAICATIRAATGWQIDVRVLAIILVAQALASVAMVPRALLRRQLRFQRIVGGELTGQFLGNLVLAVILAWAGWGPFALAMGVATGQIIAAVWVLTAAPRDILHPRLHGMAGLLRTMYGVVKVASLEAVNGQITPVAVTSVLGAVALGLFNRVYTLVTLPVQLLVSSANRVMISGLVAVADDPERRRNAMYRLLRVVSSIITPLSLGVAGAGQSFVSVVLGDRWLSAAPIVPLLSVAVIGNMLGAVLAQLAEATQRFNEKVRTQALSTVLLVVALILGGRWGLVGVAAGAMAGALIFCALYLRLTSRIIDVPVGTLLRWLAPSWAAGLASFAAARGAGAALAGHADAYLTLAAQIAACGLSAGTLLLLLDKPLLIEMAQLTLPARLHNAVGRALG
jgi:PST family polysaccharide transporter